MDQAVAANVQAHELIRAELKLYNVDAGIIPTVYVWLPDRDKHCTHGSLLHVQP